MRRIKIAERPNWRERAAELGFTFHSPNGETYWDESAYYAFTIDEIETQIEAPTAEIEALSTVLVDRILRDETYLIRLQIPENSWDYLRDSWRRNLPSLYGRLDFSFSGHGPAKLLEYNADTPTSLYEAAAFQWFWLEDGVASGALPTSADQYNSIHEALVARFRELSGQGTLHLSCVGHSEEDRGTISYIDECARQGGFDTRFIAMSDIGLGADGQFYDLDNRPINRLFKLYPWEWMLREPFGDALAKSKIGVLEPAWKAVLSNKGILPLLWELAPNHPNLLPAYFDGDPRAADLSRTGFARKPLYSREGANIELHDAKGGVIDTDGGPYGAEGYVLQGLAPLPAFDGHYAVLGSWIVAGRAVGLGIREDRSPITKNTSRFVPHAIIA